MAAQIGDNIQIFNLSGGGITTASSSASVGQDPIIINEVGAGIVFNLSYNISTSEAADTFDVKIQDSDDNITYHDIFSFAQITGEDDQGSQTICYDKNVFKSYVRAYATIVLTGDTPLLAYSIVGIYEKKYIGNVGG